MTDDPRAKFEQARETLYRNLAILRSHRTILATIGTICEDSLAMTPQVIEYGDASRAANDAVAAVDRLNASLVRAFDRIEATCFPT